MKKNPLIITLSILALLVVGGVSAVVIHNEQVAHQKAVAQAKVRAKANEVKYLKQANTAVNKAYQTKKDSDIASAQSAIKKLNSSDKKAPTDKLTLLTTALTDLSSADNLISTAEKATSTAEANLVQVKKDAQAKIDAQKMDLGAIAKGDYSSIQGTWTDAIGDTLLVSQSSITMNGTALNLSNAYKSTYSDRRYDDGSGLITWADGNGAGSIQFIPKNIGGYLTEPSPGEFQTPAHGDITKERLNITLAHENKEHLFYKQGSTLPSPDSLTISEADQTAIDNAVKNAQTMLDKIKLPTVLSKKAALQTRLNKVSGKVDSNSTTENKNQANSDLNVNQIANGDYSSIQGTWKNSNGNTITVSGSTITENGNVITPIQHVGKDYLSITGTLNLLGQGKASPPNLLIVPKGISIAGFMLDKTDKTDQSKNRIIETENFQAGGTGEQVAEATYYKVN